MGRSMSVLLGILLVLSISIAGLSHGATGKPPSDFRGIQWGGAPAGPIQPIGAPSGEEKLETWKNNKKPPPVLGVPVAEELYLFSKGKLYGGMLFFDTQKNFLTLKDKLVKLYGTPDVSDDGVPIYRWKWILEEINMYITYQGASERTTISFVNDRIQ
jgi:hypothetical protein